MDQRRKSHGFSQTGIAVLIGDVNLHASVGNKSKYGPAPDAFIFLVPSNKLPGSDAFLSVFEDDV